jgi:hypothetical protein
MSAPKETVATVEWIRGNRMVSRVMRNAGLGLNGVGIKETVRITYKPGEVVDADRVMRAVNRIIKEADDANLEFEISCPRVIRIEQQAAASS